MNAISTAILKVLVDTFVSHNSIIRLTDLNGEIDATLAEAFHCTMNSNAMFLGNTEWAFGHDTNTSLDVTLFVLDDGSYPIAVLVENHTPLTELHLSFLTLVSDMLENDLDFTNTVQELHSFQKFKQIASNTGAYTELVTNIAEDSSPFYLYLSTLDFSPDTFAEILDEPYEEISHCPKTQAYGLEIDSSEILSANENFKLALMDLESVNSFQVSWGRTVETLDITVLKPSSENKAPGIYIQIKSVIFRLYAGVKMSDNVSQPGITFACRINPDLPWEYENVLRSTCVNVSPFLAIHNLMSQVFNQPSFVENFSYAAFQALYKLGLSYGQQLENYDDYRSGVTYENYVERNQQFISSQPEIV